MDTETGHFEPFCENWSVWCVGESDDDSPFFDEEEDFVACLHIDANRDCIDVESIRTGDFESSSIVIPADMSREEFNKITKQDRFREAV